MRTLVVAALLSVVATAAPTTDVYTIGDSTMADKPTPETNPEQGWGQHLSAFFDSTVAIHNHAVNGRSTKSFIDEGKWSDVLRRLKRDDYVFIQFSHNDEKIEDSTRYTNPATTFQANLERFVTESRSKGAHPVLFTPIVRRKFDARGALIDTHAPYPDAVRAVAKRLAVPLVDLQTLTAELVRAAGPERSKRYYVWVAPGEFPEYPEARQDDTHLSVVGATEVAKLAARTLAASDVPIGHHVTAK